MRLRGQYKKSRGGEKADSKALMVEGEIGEEIETAKMVEQERESEEVKIAKKSKSARPFGMIGQLMGNPNFNMQLMVILLSLTSDNIQMDRRIDGMTTTIEKVRNITELVNNGVQSMKMVSEVPKSIRRLLE